MLAEPIRIQVSHDCERLIEEAHGMVRVELDRACRHTVRKVPLRLHVAFQFRARILQFLDVDREPGDGAGRQWNIHDVHHPPLATDGGRLHLGDGLAAFERRLGRCTRAVVAARIDQLGGTRDHVGSIARLDRLDERAVHEAEAEVRAPVPHRERSGLDQLRQGIERRLGLPDAQRQLGTFSLRRTCVGQPEQHCSSLFRRRSRPASNLEDAIGARSFDLQLQWQPRQSSVFDRLLQSVQVVAGNPAIVDGQIRPGLRLRLEPQLADQPRIRVQRPVGPNEERSIGSDVEERGKRSRGADERARFAHPPAGDHHQCSGDRKPQARDPQHDPR